MLYLPCIGGDAADIFDVGVSHAPQRAGCLAASGPAVTVDKQGGVLVIYQARHLVKSLERHVFAAGNMALPVLLGCADIQQNGPGSGLIVFHALADVGAFQEIEESHTRVHLTAWQGSGSWVLRPPSG